MRYTEGRAWIQGCPRCEHPTALAHTEGMQLRLSTKSVPFRDAAVFSRYARLVVNLRIGSTQLYATLWHHTSGPPREGRLYIEHRCGARN